MKKVVRTVLTIMIAFVAAATFATEFNQPSDLDSSKAIALSLAPIKSSKDLKNYLKMTPLSASPLNKFTKLDRLIFLNSITFNDKGVTGFNIQILKNSLLVEDAKQVLSLFGYQHLIIKVKSGVGLAAPSEGIDWECGPNNTCIRALGKVCTRNC